MRLSLHLFTTGGIELSRVELTRGDAPPIVCVRGKSQDHDADGCFQWTSAVKAFAELAVGTRLAVARGGTGYRLVGEQGSQAASLDYAISKPTQWVVDLFGRERGGRPFAARVFQRHNTERKLPGPVSVQLVPSFSEPGAIRIHLDGTEISDAGSLEELLAGIRGERSSAQRGRSQSAAWYREPWFLEMMHAEVLSALSEVTVMERLALERARERLARYQWARSSSSIETVLGQLEATAAERRYRDVSGEELRILSSTEIEISTVPFALGALALFNYLEKELSVPLRIDYRFSGAVEIAAERNEGREPSARVLSWGAVSRLSTGWDETEVALALLPRTGFSILVPSGTRIPEVRVVFAAADPRGYPRQILEECSLFENAPEARDASLAEIPVRLASGEGAAILAFPLSEIDRRLVSVEAIAAPGTGGRIADNILMVRGMHEDARGAFAAALRTAWFRLLEKEGLREGILRALLEEEGYVEFLERLGGLHERR